jgi:hypothetical protein
MPDGRLPSKWFITPTAGRPFTVVSGTPVRVPYETEGGSFSFLGQITDAVRGKYWGSIPEERGIALSDSVPASSFHAVPAPNRASPSLLRLIRERFQDSAARANLYAVREKPRPVPSMSPIHQISLWQALIPGTPDSIFAAEATRCYPAPGSGPCTELTVYDIWIVKHGSELRVLRERPPIIADEDFKGGSTISPVGIFRSMDHTFMLVREGGYSGSAAQIWELLAAGSRNLTPPGSAVP